MTFPFPFSRHFSTDSAATENRWLFLDQQAVIFLLISGAFCIYVLKVVASSVSTVKAPVVGYRSFAEPNWLVGLRFFRNSVVIINEGYGKYKNSMFKIRRNDGEILIISNKHADHIRSLPEHQVSGLAAHVKNLSGQFTNTTILLEGDLLTRVIQQRLTPNLALVALWMKEELDYAIKVEVPECQDEWVSVSIHDILLRLVNRVSARVFLGPVACRNEEWLSTSIRYTENIQGVILTLRMLPTYMHYFVAPLLPAYWRVRANLATAKHIIGPIVRKHQAAGNGKASYDGTEDILQWMMHMGSVSESRPNKLAHRQLLLSMAAVHTSSMSAAHAMYDLCAYPQYFDPLREELESTLKSSGGWTKPAMPKLRKLDSFLKESQRVNPPASFAFNRIVREPLRLADGTILPPGTHIAMASDAILNDPEYLPGENTEFEPFRWARLRDDPAHPENVHRYQFATTDSNNLHFGHGKYACPGRFYAGQQIKMILGHLILLYDFKYPFGQGRPRNLCSDENIYPDPLAKVLIRRRNEK
ncbi:cytochrome P450 [Annulohypoxylon truncatum]|uniref:cytochrome P450 n=1 Tax=Annulohypoxylon truncatum TaxID=327061 RepID=UPI002008D475|nr:cytochrome P450 [Annulohypoxylon truncatum]KAI1213728.1 cytochrome P450 [Annulohypoxylon truncatum]